MDDLKTPPATLVDAKGAPHEGAFRGRIASLSLEDAVVPGLGVLAQPGGPRAPIRRLKRKSWRFAAVFRDDLVLAAAVGDVGYLGVAWAYAAEGDRLLERGWKSPGAVGIRVGASDSASVALAPGRCLSLATTRAGGVVLSLDVPGLRASLDLDGNLTPLTVVSDVGRGEKLLGVTVKQAGLSARGTVEVEGRSYTLDDARACVDWTEAFFPRRIDWFWATAAGLAGERAVGLNLARGVHDDPKGRFTENALWLDGEPAALPPVTFLSRAPGQGPWEIRSEDRSVDLLFEPRGERKEDVNLLLVTSRYRQPFGSYSGKLRDALGREVRIERLPGIAEEHSAVW
ncbi:DUF2804 domain-containing protein [bacterium]|nr:DUF2804 domain-containing protein [bacterium]